MKGPIAWFVKNPIAANLLMALIMISGFSSLGHLEVELFPEQPLDVVTVTVPYPGAAPSEVEEQITLRLEEAVGELDGVDELKTYSMRGSAVMNVTVRPEYDVKQMLNEVKAQVDAINTMPVDAERPIVKEMIHRRDILEVAVIADTTERSLKQLAEQVRDSVTNLPGVDYVMIEGTRVDEVSIEVSEQTLRRYNLTFEMIAAAIRSSSLELSAGQVRTSDGAVQLRTSGQAYTATDFENIVVLQNSDGTQLRLGEIANVSDSFADVLTRTRFNGKPAVRIEVYNVHNPNVLNTARSVRDAVEDLQRTMPEGVELLIWGDKSVYLDDRIALLSKNAIGGLVIVLILLMLFLRPLLAFWVAMGIGVAYLGALAMMPFFGVSINLLSLFAFLLVLGIVVDDAIVVGESVHAHYERGMRNEESAIVGARGVVRPVTTAVITTLMVFGAMLLLPKQTMRLFTVMPLVALPALAISLLESFLILPAHLRHMKPEREPKNRILRTLHNARMKCSNGMGWFAQHKFGPFIQTVVKHRFITLSSFLGVLMLVISLYGGGWIKTDFWPQISGERVRGEITLQEGLSWDQILDTTKQVEVAIESLKSVPEFIANNGQPVVNNLRVDVQENLIFYNIELLRAQYHNVASRDVELRLREQIGDIEHVEEFASWSSMGWRPTKDISFELSGANAAVLDQAVAKFLDHLARIPGVIDVEDSVQKGVPELEFSLKENAESLDVGLAQIARQLRQGFYGEEVQRIPRVREDVRVMVRYPKSEREDLETLREFRVRTGDGREVPLDSVVDVAYSSVPPAIIRTDRKRSVIISADLSDDQLSAPQLLKALQQFYHQEISPLFPGVGFELGHAEQDREEFQSEFLKAMWMVIIGIYGLIAVLFRSYWQPLLVITAIPFGLGGAIVGHWVLNIQMSMMSLCGMLAAVGVVVNDNLVLIDRINQLRKEGWDVGKAVVQASRDRFRPIVLTSITTFCGLMPILLETSTQAQFLVPTAVSLSWGVMAATFVTLLLVPCLYLMGERVLARLKRENRHDEQLVQ